MKKIISVTLAIVLASALSLSTALAMTPLPGLPKTASLAIAGFVSEKQRAAIVAGLDRLSVSAPFKKFVETFEEKSKISFPSGLFEAVKKVSSFSIAIYPDQTGMQKVPRAVSLMVTFDDSSAASDALARTLKKIASISKSGAGNSSLKITDTKIEGLQATMITGSAEAPATPPEGADGVPNMVTLAFVNQKTLGMVISPSEKESDTASIVKEIVASLNDEKFSLTSKEKFVDAMSAVGESAGGLFYFDADAFIDKMKGEDRKIAELLNYAAIGLEIAPDLSRFSATGVFSINQIKSDAKAAQGMELLNALLGVSDKTSTPASILPSNLLSLLGLRLNINQDTLALPSFMPSKLSFTAVTGGLKIEDLLSWFNGDVFAGFGDYTIDIKAIMDKSPEAPDLYIGFGTSSPEKTYDFFGKVIGALKKKGFNLEFSDEMANDIKVKTATIKKSPLKNLVLTAGCVGDYFVVASTRNAFENLVVAKSRPEMSLKENSNYKQVVPQAAASAYFYLNSEKLFRLADFMAILNPQLKGFATAGFIKQLALTMTFKPEKGTSRISASVYMQNDTARFPIALFLDAIDAVTSKIKTSTAKKAKE